MVKIQGRGSYFLPFSKSENCGYYILVDKPHKETSLKASGLWIFFFVSSSSVI